MKSQTEVYEALGFLYEKNPLPTIVSSADPNGGFLNIDKALADNPECWDTISIKTSQFDKKTIILNCDTATLNKDYRYLVERIIKKLIQDNFNVYYTSEEGFTKLDNLELLTYQYENYIPIDSIKEDAELKKLNLARDRIEFVDTAQLNHLIDQVLKNSDLFIYFINSITIEPQKVLGLNYSEEINPDFISAMEWSLSDQEHANQNWALKHNEFNVNAEETDRNTLWKTFFASLSHQTNQKYIDYLIKYKPDLFKNIKRLTVSNCIIPLNSFLNQYQLNSLSLNNCELITEGNNSFTTCLKFLEMQEVKLLTEMLYRMLNDSPDLISLSIVVASSVVKPIKN